MLPFYLLPHEGRDTLVSASIGKLWGSIQLQFRHGCLNGDVKHCVTVCISCVNVCIRHPKHYNSLA